jgi:hypothetical protein
VINSDAGLLTVLRALPAPDRAWARETLRRMVDKMPAFDRRHVSGDIERVRQDNHLRDLRVLHEAIDAIPETDPRPSPVTGASS